jgi:hypothetical protein
LPSFRTHPSPPAPTPPNPIDIQTIANEIKYPIISYRRPIAVAIPMILQITQEMSRHIIIDAATIEKAKRELNPLGIK